jgi:putative intracellular protease/amidase
MSTILFVVSSARTWTLSDGTAHPTGFWAEELLTPYRLFTAAGHRVVFATPDGLPPVADEASFGDDGEAERAALAAIADLATPLRVDEVEVAAYDAVFYPGGHGPMEDLARDAQSGALIRAALDADKPIGLVCHGVAALLASTAPDGALSTAGRRVAAFTDEEETQAGLADRAPWLLESTLRDRGLDVVVAGPWTDHVVTDGNLVTGQNPQSSASVASALLERLR